MLQEIDNNNCPCIHLIKMSERFFTVADLRREKYIIQIAEKDIYSFWIFYVIDIPDREYWKFPIHLTHNQYLTAVAVMITVTSLIPQMFFIL